MNAVRKATRRIEAGGPAVAHEAQYLGHEQGISFSRGEDRVSVALPFGENPLRDLVAPEAAQRQVTSLARDSRQRFTGAGRKPRFGVAIGPDEHDAGRMNTARHEVQELERAEIRA